MRQLVNLKLRSNTSIVEHTSNIQNLVNQLKYVKLNLGDKEQALLLFNSIPKS